MYLIHLAKNLKFLINKRATKVSSPSCPSLPRAILDSRVSGGVMGRPGVGGKQ